MYTIRFTPEAIADWECFRKTERRLILDNIALQLAQEPTVETRNRKRLRPNRLAEWELRVGKFRVFYEAVKPPGIVRIEAIGHKVGNVLLIRNEEYEL